MHKGEYLTVGWRQWRTWERIRKRPGLRSKPRTAKPTWRIHWRKVCHKEKSYETKSLAETGPTPSFHRNVILPINLRWNKCAKRKLSPFPADTHNPPQWKDGCVSFIDPSIPFDHALYRFIPTDCIARNGAWPKRLQSSDDSSDICHTRASFWHNKRCECTSSSVPHKPKEPYKIGQANDESQTKMRKPPQPVTQRITKKFPPMTSSDVDFPARPVYDVHRSSSPLKHELFSQESSHVNPSHSDMSTVEREIQGMPIPYLWSSHRDTQRTYFSPDRLVLGSCVAKYRSRQSAYSLHSSQTKHEKEIHIGIAIVMRLIRFSTV